VFSAALDLAAGTSEQLASVPVEDPQQLYLFGPLLAVATGNGLVLIEVGDGGALSRIGATLEIPRGAPSPLLSVLVAQDTVWVSGDGIGLAAVDVTHPEVPRLVGWVEGPAATKLARLEGSVVALTTDPVEQLRVYPAPARGALQVGRNLTEDLGLAEGAVVTAMATAPGRSGVPEEGELLAIAFRDPGDRAPVRLYERESSDRYVARDETDAFVLVNGVDLDEGTLLVSTTGLDAEGRPAGGAAGVVIRGPGPGELTNVTRTQPAMGERDPRAFWATTTDAGNPLVVIALRRVLRVVELSCSAS
jgi:hypothetical protein